MNNDFDVYLTKILKNMEEERYILSHPFVGSEHLLLALLKNDKETILLFHDHGVTYDNFSEKLKQIVGTCKKNVDFNLYTPLLKRVINYAVEEAALNKEKVNSKYIIESLLEENEGVAIRILNQMNVDLDDIYRTLSKSETVNKKSVDFGKNLNETVSMEEKVVGREKEIEFIIETLLRKNKNNPILIGDAGVGKSAIVEELARKINNQCVPKKLRNSCIINLDISSVVAGTKYRGEFEEKLNKIIETSEKDNNIILFIDEIHTITSAGGAEGAIGAGDIFKPCLARGNIKVIGATTTEEYEKYIQKDKALARRFETVLIKEPSKEKTIDILNKIKGEYESFHNVLISKKNVIDIVSLADKYILNKKNPDKSIDFLDSVSSFVQLKNDNSKTLNKYLLDLKNVKEQKERYAKENKYNLALKEREKEILIEEKLSLVNAESIKKISLKDIHKVLETKINVPCFVNKEKLKKIFKEKIKNEINSKELETLFNTKIEDFGVLKTIYINGDEKMLVNALKSTLESICFIKINGEDYESENSIIKLTGSYQGYNNKAYIFKKIKINPYVLMHIDNFDKMSNNIKSLFKEIIKNQTVKDEEGNEISFRNSIMVFSDKIKEKNKVGFENTLNSNVKMSNINFDLILQSNELEKQK